MDAQRGEVYGAYYPQVDGQQMPAPVGVPIVGQPEAILASLPEDAAIFIGDGALRYEAHIRDYMGARHRVLAPPAALAPFIAHIGIARAANGEAGPPHALQPLYVRRPDAELARGKK
jgi:tRNA A37 threonylcarbamoyladenosine modification protein TsaB